MPRIGDTTSLVDEIESLLKDAGYGLDALKDLIELIDTTDMRGTDGAALASAWTAGLATILGNFTALTVGYLDNPNILRIPNLSTLTADKIGYLDNPNLLKIPDLSTLTALIITYIDNPQLLKIPDLSTLTALIITYLDNPNLVIIPNLSAFTPTVQGYLDEAISAPKAIKATDETGSFTWVTATHTTSEGDISALFTTPLTGTTRRRYSVMLDLDQVEDDGAAWTECTIKVKVKIDTSNYAIIDKKVLAKTDVAETAEPGVPIDIPAVCQDVQITMQLDVQLSGDATIYYTYVKELLE